MRYLRKSVAKVLGFWDAHESGGLSKFTNICSRGRLWVGRVALSFKFCYVFSVRLVPGFAVSGSDRMGGTVSKMGEL